MTKSGWGGRRAGAGRPRTTDWVSRKRRPEISGRVEVVLRLRSEVGAPRKSQLKEALAAGSDRFGMRVTSFTIAKDHIRLVVDAKNRRALSRGMQGLSVRLAKAFNRATDQRGKLFADRYEVVQ